LSKSILASLRRRVLASGDVRNPTGNVSMSYGSGLIFYVLGSLAVGFCLWCIPGRGAAAAPPPPDRGPGGH